MMASTKRRRLTLAATLVSLSALVAACGGGGGGDSTTEGQGADKGGKVVLKYWDMQWGSPTFMGQLKKNVAEFNKANPNVEVKFTQLSWGDYQQKLLSAVQAGNPPDVGGGDSGIPFNMDAQGQALDISDLFDQRAIYYRKDLLEQAGIEVPTTWDELKAAAEALNDPANDRVGIAVPGKQ